jgi:hypothetical protein
MHCGARKGRQLLEGSTSTQCTSSTIMRSGRRREASSTSRASASSLPRARAAASIAS